MDTSTVYITARLDTPPPWPGGGSGSATWYITHPLGGLASGMFTAVVMPDFAPDGAPLSDAAKEAAVRQVAEGLYGTAYAFIYRPDQATRAVHSHGMIGREHVTITSVEVYE